MAPVPPRPARLRVRSFGTLAALLATTHVAAPSLAAQHTHGTATLDIGISGQEGTAQLRATGEDLWGFERAPRTAADRAARSAALARLRDGGGTLLRLAPTLGCAVVADSVLPVRTTQGHEEVTARYRMRCRRPLAGSPIGFGVTALFPRITRVRVQLVSDTAQVGREVVRDQGRVVPE